MSTQSSLNVVTLLILFLFVHSGKILLVFIVCVHCMCVVCYGSHCVHSEISKQIMLTYSADGLAV